MKQQLICLVACLLAVFTGFGQLVDVSVETFYTDDGLIPGYPAGHTTYRIYGVLADGSDALTACFGASDDLLELGSTTATWNTPLGGITGPDLNPAFFGFVPQSEYDSFVTIGRANSLDPGVGVTTVASNPSPLAIMDAFGTTSPSADEFDAALILNDGTWFSTPDGANCYGAAPDFKVLLAQVTTDGDLEFKLNVQVIDGGIGGTPLKFVWNPATAQSDENEVAAPYLEYPAAGTPGCIDATACNYNADATEDDSSCVYASGCDTCSGETDGSGTVVDNPEEGEACDDGDATTIDDVIQADCSCAGVLIVEGCTDLAACNYDPAANTEDGSCTYEGCTDPTACNYDATAGCDDGTCEFLTCAGCTDATACNYDATATIEDGSCDFSCYGCTDAAACNYDPAATIDDGSCDLPNGCIDAGACNYDAAATCDDGSCEFDSCAGCTDAAACNYDATATIDDGSCDLPNGCTDAGACNYDATATCDDGSCEFDSCAGCTDAAACNYDATATIDDGSCDLPNGCTETEACNYDATATCDDGSCEFDSCAGCTDAAACNYDATATIDDGSCEFDSCVGCTDPTACNYDPSATTSGSAQTFTENFDGLFAEELFADQTVPTNDYFTSSFLSLTAGTWEVLDMATFECAALSQPNAITWNPDCCTTAGATLTFSQPANAVSFTIAGNVNVDIEVTHAGGTSNYSEYGNADAGNIITLTESGVTALTFNTDFYGCLDNITFTIGDTDTCVYPGCTDATACNYDATAGCDDGGCDFSCYGCTETEACNYDPTATIEDGSCDFSCYGCTETEACNYDDTATIDDGSCDLPNGCTDAAACNYDPAATCDDGSCEFDSCVGCTDPTACNYDPSATTSGSAQTFTENFDGLFAEELFADQTVPTNDYFTSSFLSLTAGTWEVLDMATFECAALSQPNAITWNPDCCTTAGATLTFSQPANAVSFTIAGNVNVDIEVTHAGGTSNYSEYGNADAGNIITLTESGVTALTFNTDFYGCLDNITFTIGDTDTCVYPGCTDATACNYDATAGCDDGGCDFSCYGCTETEACNYDPTATIEDGSCDFSCYGCTETEACNYDDTATIDDGSCEFTTCAGCTDMAACNYDATATIDDGTCTLPGCNDDTACNYDDTAGCDDGSCTYPDPGYDCDGNCVEAPANDLCENATPITCGQSIEGSTECATDIGFPGSCSEDFSTNGLGVWFTFVGNGEPVLLSLCDDVYDYDTHIVLFNGECGNLTCIDGNDDWGNEVDDVEGDLGMDLPTDCGSVLQSVLINNSQAGETYYVYVTGYNSNVGSFDFTLVCSDVDLCELDSCPEDLTVECGDSTDPADTGEPTVSGDGCQGSWDYTDVIDGDDCLYTITRSWVYTDAVGAELLTCEQVITVQDTTSPVFDTEPMDVTVSCLGEVPVPEDLTATDACNGADVEIFESETGTIVETCVLATAEGPGEDWAVWLPGWVDAGIAPTAYWHFITPGVLEIYDDGTARATGTLQNSADASLQIELDLWLENAADWDTWSGMGRLQKDTYMTGNYPDWMYYEVVAGFSTISGVAGISGEVQLSHFPLSYLFGFQCGEGANDRNGNDGLGGWFWYDGTINGQSVEGQGDVNVDKDCETIPESDCPHDDEFTYLYRAFDACGNQTIVEQIITVLDEIAPEFTEAPADITIECDELDTLPDPADVTVTATDNCAGDVTIEYLGEFDGGGDECLYTILRRWRATDLCGNTADHIQTITVVDTTAPEFTFVPEDLTLECDQEVPTTNAEADDNCGSTTVTYVDYYQSTPWVADLGGGNGEVNFDNLPSEILITGSDDSDAPTIGVVTLAGTVVKNTTISFDWDYMSMDVAEAAFDPFGYRINGVPTQLTDDALAAQTGSTTVDLNAGDSFELYIDAEDDALGEGFVAVNNITVTASVECPITECFIRQFTAEDECGNASTANQFIVIQDTTAPEFTFVPADATYECDETVVLEDATAVDNCLEVTITVDESTADGDCPQEYVLTRTFTATDACGNATSATQTITVQDTTAPVLEVAGDLTLECDEEVPAADWTVSDNCDTEVTVLVTEAIVDGDCPQAYVLTRTYTATDDCGNESTDTQVITVVDTTAPEFTFVPEDLTLECDQEVPTTNAEADDNCGSTTVTYVDYYESTPWVADLGGGNGEVNFDNLPSEILITGSDDSDAPTFGVVTLAGTVVKNTTISFDWDYMSMDVAEAAFDPFGYRINGVPTQLTDDALAAQAGSTTVDLNAGDSFELYIDSEDDALGEGFVAVNNITVTASVECPITECFIRQFTAEDECGNASTANQFIVIQDTTAPEFTFVPADATYECDETVVLEDATAVDNCLEVTITVDESTADGDCPQEYVLTRTFTATDACGNATSATQTITVQDTTAPVLEVAGDLTLECDEEVPAADWTVSDNCDTEVTVLVTEAIVDGDCPQEYELTRTYTATDACGNVSTDTQVITVVDTTAPVFEDHSPAISIECDELETLGTLTATDNCGEVTVEVEDILLSGGCLGTLQRSYTATDECGNVATTIQYVNLLDTTVPVIENPADMTVECDEVDMLIDPATVVITDNCSDDIDVVFTETVTPGDCDNEYTITWSWTATDYCENVAMATTVITVVDTTKPEWTFIPEDVEASCDDVPAPVMPTAEDNCDEDVQVIMTGEAVTPGDCIGNYTITYTYIAVDNCGNEADAVSYTIFVDDNEAPVFTLVPADVTYECDETVALDMATAMDNCGTVTVTHEDFIIDGDCTGNYTIERVFTASDDCGNAATATQEITIEDTVGPVIEGETAVEVSCDETDGIFITATDACGSEVTITYEDQDVSGGCIVNFLRVYTATDDCGNASTFEQILIRNDETVPVATFVPADATYECDEEQDLTDATFEDNCDPDLTIAYSETLTAGDCPQEYTLVRMWTATDDCGNATSASQTITVVDTTAPVFTFVPADASYECDETIAEVNAEADDNCGDVEVTWADETNPGSCPNSYVIIRTFTATDACGNSTTAAQTITVIDTTPPVFTFVPADANYECDSEVVLEDAMAMDNCGDVIITSSEEMTPGDCPNSYVLVRTWIATDACGNESSASQTINVEDVTAPEFTFVPADATYECDETVVLEDATAVDNCLDVTITVDEETTAGDCPQAYTLVRTFTATDACGNATSSVQVITVVDTTAPEFTFVPEDLTLECDQEVPTTNAEADDNCGSTTVTYVDYYENTPWVADLGGGNGEVNFDNLPSEITIGGSDDSDAPTLGVVTLAGTVVKNTTISFDWAYSTADEDGSSYDPFGYSVNGVATQLTIDGLFEDQSGTATVDLNAGDSFELYIDSEDDAFGEGFVAVNNITVTASVECPITECFIRQFTAEDECGNASTANQFIVIQDTTAPEFTFVPADATYECDETVVLEDATAVDNCLEVTITVDESTADGDCPQEYVLTRTFTATDACGNATSATQTITVQDTTAPVLEVAGDLTLECDEEVPAADWTVSDNCDTEVTVLVTEAIVDGDCPQAYVLTRTYTATDDCGNESTDTQVITVVDTTAPEFTFVPEDLTLECDQEVPTTNAEADDNCGSTTVTYVDYYESTPWVADLGGGNGEVNFDNLPSEITIGGSDDSDAPTLGVVTLAGTVVKNTTISFDWAYSTADEDGSSYDPFGYSVNGVATQLTIDGLFEDQSGTATVDLNAGDSFELYIDSEDDSFGASSAEVTNLSIEASVECPITECFIRQFTAEDECGNASTANQFIVIQDTTAPEFTFVPVDVTIECSDEVPAEEATAVDNCSEVTVTSADEVDATGCDSEYTIVRTFTATDACGNASTAVQVITVEDTTAPELSDLPADIVLDCEDEVPAAPILTAFDACDGDVEVTFEETLSGDVAPEGAESHCNAIDPINQIDPQWSLVLFNMPEGNQYYTTIDANWTTFPDNGDGKTAVLTGTVVSADNPNAGFEIYAEFENGVDWATWDALGINDYKDDWGVGDPFYMDWTYYIMSSSVSTLTGWGDLAGSLFDLEHAPDNEYYAFQEGMGASNTDQNGVASYGIGGWFTYDGQYVNAETGVDEARNGNGDFGFTLECCPDYTITWTWTATDCAGNVTTHTATVTFEDLDGVDDGNLSVGCVGDFNFDGTRSTVDMLMLLGEWGCIGPNCACEITGDEEVTTPDMLYLLGVFNTDCE